MRVAPATVTPPPIGGLDAADRLRLADAIKLRIGRLQARLTEAVSDIEHGRPALLCDALGGLLATIDALDAHLTDIEAWANQVAAERELFVGADRDRHRAEFGLPPFGKEG